MYLRYIYLALDSMVSFCVCFSVKLEQGTVTSLIEEDGTIKGVHYKNKAGEELEAFAPLTIVCDGCFSNLRRSLCNPKVRRLFTFFWPDCILSLPHVNNFIFYNVSAD